MDSIRRQLAFDIQKKSEKYHRSKGFPKYLMDIDKAIAIIRGTEEEKNGCAEFDGRL